MKRSAIKQGLVTALAAVILLWSASTGRAAFAIKLISGTAVTVNDNGTGDLDPALGSIKTLKDVGGFMVDLTASQTNTPGTSTLGSITLSLTNLKRTSGFNNSLTVEASATGYTNPPSPVKLISRVDTGGFPDNAPPTDQYTFQSFLADSNVFFSKPAGTSTPLQTVHSDNSVTPAVTVEHTGITYTVPYSLDVQAVFHLALGDSISHAGGRAEVRPNSAVPAPGAAILCASAIMVQAQDLPNQPRKN